MCPMHTVHVSETVLSEYRRDNCEKIREGMCVLSTSTFPPSMCHRSVAIATRQLSKGGRNSGIPVWPGNFVRGMRIWDNVNKVVG